MSSVPPSPQQDIPNWTDPAVPRLDPERPYLRIGHATVFVRDQDRSLRFYRDRLGFSLVADFILATGIRWLAVAPPNGTAILEIVAPAPGSEEYALVGRTKRLTLITEDVDSLYEQWSERGVVFRHPPRPAEWGGIFTQLYDPDGNATTLVSIDSVTKKLDEERQAAAARQEAERRSLQEMEIARQVQTRLFPQALPRSSTLDFAGSCVQSRAVGGDYYDFLDFGDDRLGLVIGDVAGKGIAAALLMVSLQATLRSQIGRSGSVCRRFSALSTSTSTPTLPTAPTLLCFWPSMTEQARFCATSTAATCADCFSVRTALSAVWSRQPRSWVCSPNGRGKRPSAGCSPRMCSCCTPTV